MFSGTPAMASSSRVSTNVGRCIVTAITLMFSALRRVAINLGDLEDRPSVITMHNLVEFFLTFRRNYLMTLEVKSYWNFEPGL